VTTLSEAQSKRMLAAYGVPVAREETASTAAAAGEAADRIGYPVVVKLCGASIAHKTERGLVRVGLADRPSVEAAAVAMLGMAQPGDGEVENLVAEMVGGSRELIAGLVCDPQFGPCVMLGVGGILAEAVADVAFRLVPLSGVDAHDLVDELGTRRLFGEFRGEPAVDRDRLAAVVAGLSTLAGEHPEVVSVDINPLIVAGGVPVAVDALVELRP